MNTIVEERQDHWLTAILWACQHFGIRCHALKVVNGLPLENGQLSEALFQRAAEQAQLEVGLTNLSLLEQATFPCLAVEKQGSPLLILGREGERYRCLSPHEANSDLILSLDELKTQVKEGVWQLSTQVAADGRVESLIEEKPVHWFRQVLMEVRPWYRDLLLASFVINLLAMVVPLFTMNVYDRVVPNQAFHTLWVLSVGVIIVVVFDWVLREARSSVTDMAGRYVENKLSAQLFQKVLGMRLEQRPQSVGAFARQLQDFDSVKDFLTSVSLVTLVDLPFTLFFLLLIGWLGGAMMLIPLAVMAALLLLSFVMKGRLAQTFTESARLSTQRQAHVYDSLSALTDIKQNNAEGMTQKRWETDGFCVVGMANPFAFLFQHCFSLHYVEPASGDDRLDHFRCVSDCRRAIEHGRLDCHSDAQWARCLFDQPAFYADAALPTDANRNGRTQPDHGHASRIHVTSSDGQRRVPR